MKNNFKGYAIYSQFGFVVISTILICIFLGKKLDDIFSTSPIFLMIFLALSLIASFINFYFKVMKAFGEKNQICKNNYIYIFNFILEAFLSIILCIFLGKFLDEKFNTNNIFIVIFILSCIIFNILIFIKKFDFKSIFRRK